MWQWLRTLWFTGGSRSIRAIVVPTGDPYREDLATPPRERTAEPRTLAEVTTRLRDAGVRLRVRRRGFDVLAATGPRVLPVRVTEPARIRPEDLACGSDAPELLLDLALALVPLFGPVTAELRYAGVIVIDGKRDRAAVGQEAAERIQRFGRRVAKHSPITFPILLELARRVRRS